MLRQLTLAALTLGFCTAALAAPHSPSPVNARIENPAASASHLLAGNFGHVHKHGPIHGQPQIHIHVHQHVIHGHIPFHGHFGTHPQIHFGGIGKFHHHSVHGTKAHFGRFHFKTQHVGGVHGGKHH